MSLTEIDWRTLATLPTEPLKAKIFSILLEASVKIQNNEVDEPELLGIVPRLTELVENRDDIRNFREVFSALGFGTTLIGRQRMRATNWPPRLLQFPSLESFYIVNS